MIGLDLPKNMLIFWLLLAHGDVLMLFGIYSIVQGLEKEGRLCSRCHWVGGGGAWAWRSSPTVAAPRFLYTSGVVRGVFMK